MNKKNLKILAIIVLIIFFITCSSIISNAVTDGVGSGAIDEFRSGANGVLGSNNKSISTAKNVLGAVRNIVQIVSMFVAVIMLMFIAIKYMVSSVAERAEIKKHAVVYVVGALIVFGVNGIITIIQQFSLNIKY